MNRTRLACAAAIVACATSANAAISVGIDDLLIQSGGGMAGGLIAAQNIGGNYEAKTVKGVRGLGISGGSVGGEIDNNESIEFTFDTPVVVTSISVAHLYTSGNFGDTVDVAAAIFVTRESSLDINPFTLTATEETVGSWDGLGDVLNDSIANSSGGGAWTVSGDDIFGSPITFLSLGSANPGNSSQGDFGFVSLTVVPVPAPGTTVLTAAVGLITLRRRR